MEVSIAGLLKWNRISVNISPLSLNLSLLLFALSYVNNCFGNFATVTGANQQMSLSQLDVNSILILDLCLRALSLSLSSAAGTFVFGSE